MDKQTNGGEIQWEPFINPDTKAATPLFNELCRGLAQIIRKLEPPGIDLSPPRLANFYRACGGNFDELFQNTGQHGLSFLYRTLGCYHSLQPTRNAFEAPSIPCLTDDGFVRWQTLQLLLCPQEHTGLIQCAVDIYDTPRIGGGFFPKTIPDKCFPKEPDADMEKWHRFVTSQINSDSYNRRLTFSPYHSPQPDATNSPGGYFARPPGLRAPYNRRQHSISDEELAAKIEAAKRRSSVPDITTPGGTRYRPDNALKAARSRSSGRPDNGNYKQANNSAPLYHYPPPEPRATKHSRRHDSNTSLDHARRDSRHGRTRFSGSRPESADDASSEESYQARKHRSSEEENSKRRPRWGASLMPSFFLSSNKRRHSSDGRVPTTKDYDRSPRRGEPIRKYRTEESKERDRYFDSTIDRNSNGVRFSGVYHGGDAPRRSAEPIYEPPPSSYRYPESQPPLTSYQPQPFPSKHSQPLPQPFSQHQYAPPFPMPNSTNSAPVNHLHNFETLQNQQGTRKQGMPIRVATVAGVNGRRYPPAETRSAIEPGMGRRERTSSMRNPVTSSAI